jgi:hypothetical protein
MQNEEESKKIDDRKSEECDEKDVIKKRHC